MADNYYPMGGVPDFYGPIMNAAAQSLVRMPDGTLRQAPQMSGPTSVGQIYGGMYASQPTSGSVSLAKADPVGSLHASGGWNQFDDQFNQPTAVVSKPKGTLKVAASSSGIPGPSGYTNLYKDQARLQPGTALAFAGNNGVSPPVAAINAALNPFAGARAGGHLSIGGLIFEPAVTGAGPGWSTADRHLSPTAGRPGLVTGPRPVNMPMMAATAAPVVAAPAQPVHGYTTYADPLQQAVATAQQNGEVYDRSRDPSFNPNIGSQAAHM